MISWIPCDQRHVRGPYHRVSPSTSSPSHTFPCHPRSCPPPAAAGGDASRGYRLIDNVEVLDLANGVLVVLYAASHAIGVSGEGRRIGLIEGPYGMLSAMNYSSVPVTISNHQLPNTDLRCWSPHAALPRGGVVAQAQGGDEYNKQIYIPDQLGGRG